MRLRFRHKFSKEILEQEPRQFPILSFLNFRVHVHIYMTTQVCMHTTYSANEGRKEKKKINMMMILRSNLYI